METLIGILLGTFFAVFFVILILGFFEIEWFKWLRNFFYDLFHRELKRELEFNPIQDMVNYKRTERARLLQEWDKEYLAALPRLWETSKINASIEQKEQDKAALRNIALIGRLISKQSIFEDLPTEEETDQEFSNWQQQVIKERYEGGYNARGHQSYY